MNVQNNLVGLVLCGGKSTRMGTDKGLLVNNTKTWAELAFSKLKSIHPTVYISINQHQVVKYTSHFDCHTIIIDTFNDIGPLGGMLSMASKYPTKDIMVLAVDFLDMETAVLNQLYTIYNKHTAYSAYVFKEKYGVQPLVAIYRANVLQKVLAQIEKQGLQTYSLKSILDNSVVFYIDVPPHYVSSFKNYNSPSDIPHAP